VGDAGIFSFWVTRPVDPGSHARGERPPAAGRRTAGAGPIQIIPVRADIANHSRWCIIGFFDLLRPNVRQLAADRNLAALLPLLGHRNIQVREEARAALHGLASTDPDPFLVLLRTGSPGVQRHSAEVLADVPGLDTARVIAALGDGDGAAPAVAELLTRGGEQALPELLRALASVQDQVRDGAVLALAGMGSVAWPALVLRLRDPSRRVRLGAARALAGGGWAPADARDAFAFSSALDDWDTVAAMGSAATPFLTEALADPHPGVREAAARTLGRSGDPGGVPPLRDLLARDPEEEVREAAAAALGLLADPRGVSTLREALSDRSHMVRAAAAAALGALGWRPESDAETAAHLLATAQWPALAGLGAVAVPGLVRALGDDYYEVRRGAAEALLGLAPVARPALEQARVGPDPTIRDEAAALLARMPVAPAPAEPGVAGGRDVPAGPLPPPGVTEPSEVLAAEPEELPVTVAPAEGAVEPEDGPAALRRLGLLGDPAALGTLAGALYAGEPAERLAAAEALASMPPDRAVPALTGALLDPDPALRESVVVSLGALGAPAAMPFLVDRLADPDDGVREAALDALARAGPAAFPALVAALGRPEHEVRAGAADLLMHAGYAPRSEREALRLAIGAEDWRGIARFGEDALDPLAALLTHPEPGLRLGAVVALGEMGGERAADLIRQAYADPSPAVRNRAARLLHLRRAGKPPE
jgi:HEAT repeat protein